MKFPDKLINYNESILPKVVLILEAISNYKSNIITLYYTLEKEFENIFEYLDALVLLYILDKIRINNKGEIELC